MRRLTLVIVGSLALSSLISTQSATATPVSKVNIAPSYQFTETDTSFKLGAVTVDDQSAYLAADILITKLDDNIVAFDDSYKLELGTSCQRDSEFVASDSTTAQVFGDQTTEVTLTGTNIAVIEALQSIWIYNSTADYCTPGQGTPLGDLLTQRRVQIVVVPTYQGVQYSSRTHHYYQLASQFVSDDLGQPTNSDGTISDPSRYFVKWTTARKNAKAAQAFIGEGLHTGYLASIDSKREFDFIDRQVLRGSGTTRPAWVSGTDKGHGGTWMWADGPGAQTFGGDQSAYPFSDAYGYNYEYGADGAVLQMSPYGPLAPTNLGTDNPLLMVDTNGSLIHNPNGTYLIVDTDTLCGTTFATYQINDPDVDYQLPFEYGSTLHCHVWTENINGSDVVLSEEFLTDAGGNTYRGTSGVQGDFYRVFDGANRWVQDGYGNFYVVSSSEFTDNYASIYGQQFWGPDSSSSTGDACTSRGARGYCTVSQSDTSGQIHETQTYVNWQNGDSTNTGTWGSGQTSTGTGVGAPQPDNTVPEGTSALMMDACSRNPDVANTSSGPQDLYGGTGYYCTVGYSDLPFDTWSTSSLTYPNQYSSDTPNQTGSTDYVIEFCGYSGEFDCAHDASQAARQGFALAVNPLQGSPTPLEVTFNPPDAQSTLLTSPTMHTETFDSFDFGLTSTTVTPVGTFTGTAHIYPGTYPAGIFGGAGATGKYASAGDITLTLNSTNQYLGFWWSAGNGANFIELQDEDGNVKATFTTDQMIQQLGQCPNSYCGNPNDRTWASGEEFAYINLRLPGGFSKIRFFGQGFEFDNVSVSETIPDRLANEQTVIEHPITSDCSSVNAALAQNTLTACPREINTVVNTDNDYSPLLDTQIAQYSYPAGITVLNSVLSTGIGDVTLSGDNVIHLRSDTIGQYEVLFTITDGVSVATSFILVNVTNDPSSPSPTPTDTSTPTPTPSTSQTPTPTPTPTPTGSSNPKSRRVSTSVVGFAPYKSNLTSTQKLAIKKFIKAHKNLTYASCTGFTGYNFRHVSMQELNKLAKSRARAACGYAKKVNPKLTLKATMVTHLKLKQDYARKVLVTLY